MSIDTIGYRSVQGRGRPGWQAVWSICRWNLKLAFRRRLFWVIATIGLLHFLLHFARIYLKAQLEAQVDNDWFQERLAEIIVTGDGAAYREFLWHQTKAVVTILAFAGVTLVTSDYRAGGVTFYLSKPLGKLHYLLGKALALVLIVGTLTLLPALCLFLEYGIYSYRTFTYWSENYSIAIGIVGYGLMLMIMPSLILLACGATTRRSAPLITVWIGIFLVLPAMGLMLSEIFENEVFEMISPWRNVRLMGEMCFGYFGDDGFGVNHLISLFVVPALCAGSIVLIMRNLHAVEVIE